MADDKLQRATPDGSAIDPWRELRKATPARVGLGRSGDTMPLGPVLAFQLAHAQARDAVHAALDVDAIKAALAPHKVVAVKSRAPDRAAYLKRPDLGRALDPNDEAALKADPAPCDCLFVIADGLSAKATAAHAVKVIEATVPLLGDLTVGPVVIATQARVALGDAIGAALGARLTIVLVGERPGLSVADSLGAYITYAPRIGRRDSERNCISNIHDKGGLSYALAARKLAWLARAALQLGATGVTLKDAEVALPESERPAIG
ncbi:Ethanolamine ammonia-lyase light chain [Beijerinckiaceae bacterium RH AL1]|nr:ethanolamine ammonia-lyase subunit EutC [Beijerinckiaceae bacterium]VVB46451.1 Ethanolamine ammonia-lyase light chain [Beijerinckiaceae bacterium RH CH11]VVB46536.1 Ethanolamine ammonia-lyase light chain [Beijerinckiaceae bacterium RH AL8]VVC55381.1 Ethanolamine ammonia-lyase light chain [Beijerinckiaceae bacterium RH AL1]